MPIVISAPFLLQYLHIYSYCIYEEGFNMQFRLLFIIISASLVVLCLIQLVLYMLITPEMHNQNYIILWWTPFMLGKRESKTCGAYKCVFTDDRKYHNDTDIGVS